MTRINVGVDPRELNTKMLIAEHREIKRIPNVIKSGRFHLTGQPKQFTLGQGHVKFFYTRIAFLQARYKTIFDECIRRGFNVTNYSDSFEGIPSMFMGDYEPTESDRNLILDRIALRLAGK
jgi:hypothetical protein